MGYSVSEWVIVHLVEALDSSDLAAVAELCAGDGDRIGDGVYL